MKRRIYLKSFILLILFMIVFVVGNFISSAAEDVTDYNGSKYKIISVNEENEFSIDCQSSFEAFIFDAGFSVLRKKQKNFPNKYQ